jgi:hypothetical protein
MCCEMEPHDLNVVGTHVGMPFLKNFPTSRMQALGHPICRSIRLACRWSLLSILLTDRQSKHVLLTHSLVVSHSRNGRLTRGPSNAAEMARLARQVLRVQRQGDGAEYKRFSMPRLELGKMESSTSTA